MLTGTPLDLTPFGPVLSWLGAVYWLLGIALAGLVLWRRARWWVKVPVAVAVLAAFVYPVLMREREQTQHYAAETATLDLAIAHFEMRCQNAGAKVTRTVENVDGVVWMKWRDRYRAEDGVDQFKLTDPYGPACGDADCLKLLLRATLGLEIDLNRQAPFYRGYDFVEAIDPADGGRYRYVMRLRSGNLDHQELEKKPVQAWSARYGVTWEDISTREDRERWIAGSSLKVVDLQTSEVLAERVGYMIDRGQGSRAGFRSPWVAAERTACPAFDTSESGNPSRWSRSQGFVFKVLQPSKAR